MTSSERLRRKLVPLLPDFATPGRLLLEHPRARELFPRYLTVNYDLVVTGIPLMEVALARAQALGHDDGVAAGLAEYLEPHIAEEMHGDEPGGALRDDLEALGVDPASLRKRPPSAKIATLIGGQYFLIFHYHPVAILGFLQLEAHHPRRESVERLIEKTGLPRDGFHQLLLHTDVDVDHAKELATLLDSLPLEPRHEEAIAVSAFETVGHLTDALLDVVQPTVGDRP
jgi:hypothetical protein